SRDSLRLAFDEPMEAWGNEGMPGLRLEPAVPLDCRWDSDIDLSCDFPEGNKARNATQYRVHVPALKTQDGRTLPAKTISAETSRPELQASVYSVQWVRGMPRIHIQANQKVDATAAAAALRLTVDGRSVPVVLSPTTARPWIPVGFILELPQNASWRGMLELSVVPGLVGSEGQLAGTQNAMLLRALLEEEPRVAKMACRPGGQMDVGTGSAAMIACLPGVVILTFNRELDETSKAQFAQQLPAGVDVIGWNAASLTEWRGDRDSVALPPGQSVQLRIDAPRTRSQVAVAPGLRSVDGRNFAAATVTIETGDHPPALRAPHAAVLLADPAAPLPITAVNAPAGRLLKVDALARSSASAEIEIPTGPINIDMPIDDQATRQALREGGLVRWTSPATGNRWDQRAQTMQIAAPQFDVLALAAMDDVLVWINDWETGEGVSGADAELMLRRPGAEPATVATARSDADGVARIRLPENYRLEPDALKDSEWFVRADAGRGRNARRAVLPLGTAGRMALANPGTDRAWGVTDRPLYRAGDTVQFRLWQRADRAGRLELPRVATGPATLHLVSVDEYKVIRSWTSTSSTGDGWSGEVELPVHVNDGTYCISPSDEPEEGACFFVGTYRAQDLWAEANAEERVLREGDRFLVDVSGGYYSGGPAAGVGVRNVATMLTGLPLSQAYPDFAAFTFVDVRGAQARSGIALRRVAPSATTDAEGHAQIELPIAFEPDAIENDQLPAFGRLQVTAELALESREGTVSNAAAARFTRHDAFVGLRLEPRWLDTASPDHVEAVVIDAEGKAVPEGSIDVEVDFLEGFDGDPVPQRVGSCQLRSRTLQACDFPRARSGRYRLTARSGDAAPTVLTQYVWSGNQADARALEPVLEVAELPGRSGGPVRVVLRQVAIGKPVLFVLSQKGRILAHLRAQTESTVGMFDLPLHADIEGEVEVTAYVRDSAGGPQDGALRTSVPVETAKVSFEIPTAKRASLEIAFEHAQVAPGNRTSLTVHNASAQPRNISISVMGDALRALAGDLLEYSNPHGRYWLGEMHGFHYGNVLSLNSFGGWNSESPWGIPLLPSPSPEEAPVVFDSAMSPVAPPPPSPPFVGESTSLDRIQVTGSRVALAEDFSAGKGRPEGPTERAGPGADGLIARLARVRGAFADTALWVGDIRLAPGERRSVEVTLPDDLTRWRAIAWSADDGDDFDMVEATIESGLPVEARLQAPVRIYPGDRARLIGNARQTANSASTVEVALQVSGAGADAEVARTVEL
ncbi:MAG: MG2 domain-containing protein, partial [Pseudomonadota bacterium]|nr:MG2 domain-containing protein [Pseudomonadota bacterium]